MMKWNAPRHRTWLAALVLVLYGMLSRALHWLDLCIIDPPLFSGYHFFFDSAELTASLVFLPTFLLLLLIRFVDVWRSRRLLWTSRFIVLAVLLIQFLILKHIYIDANIATLQPQVPFLVLATLSIGLINGKLDRTIADVTITPTSGS